MFTNSSARLIVPERLNQVASSGGQCQKGGNGNHGGHNGHGHDHLAPKTRTWCVPLQLPPHVLDRYCWMNNSTQQSEMLSLSVGDGLVSEPLLVAGRRRPLLRGAPAIRCTVQT